MSNRLVTELAEAAVTAGLAESERRPLLLRNIPKEIVATFPIKARPSDQILSDLLELSAILLSQSEPPLIYEWINRAIEMTAGRKAQEVFKQIQIRLSDQVSYEHNLSSNEQFRELKSRRDLVETALDLLQSTASFRVAAVGPFFLHPPWYAERRNMRIQIPNIDEPLSGFVFEQCRERSYQIRFIFTLTSRYREKVDEYVEPNERGLFQSHLLEAINLLWGEYGERGPDICCKHSGILHIPMIFDKAVITTYRASEMTPTVDGIISYAPDVVDRERALFDSFFDGSSRGRKEELEILRNNIRQLW